MQECKIDYIYLGGLYHLLQVNQQLEVLVVMSPFPPQRQVSTLNNKKTIYVYIFHMTIHFRNYCTVINIIRVLGTYCEINLSTRR